MVQAAIASGVFFLVPHTVIGDPHIFYNKLETIDRASKDKVVIDMHIAQSV